VLVEGGAATLQAFIHSGCWDEIRRITNTTLQPSTGVPAPVIPYLQAFRKESMLDDQIEWFANPSQITI
jgi:diaminohydroxyphosphoribosylaminopyrimidine deaminase/5-amino-6-(5-phosphoribosylamino)uracil reductase